MVFVFWTHCECPEKAREHVIRLTHEKHSRKIQLEGNVTTRFKIGTGSHELTTIYV